MSPAENLPATVRDEVEMLRFDLTGETFAIEADFVREILDLTSETKVPGAPPFAPALINFRGKVIPIADLRVAFALKALDATHDSRIIVIEFDLDGVATLIGLRADQVREVSPLAWSKTEPVPALGMRWRPDYVRRVGRCGDNPVIIPDLGRIFAAELERADSAAVVSLSAHA